MKHLPSILTNTIKHKDQNYNTVGDYGENKEFWWVHISKMDKWQYEAMVLIHELVEMILTKHRRINWDKITKFDVNNPQLEEPGLNKKAPYHKEHLFATKIEKSLCCELNLDWNKYDEAVTKL